MVAGWKTVRVFISSTFRDMHGERDHLVRVVFPELKERCRTRHVQLVDVDLRWGVTEADAEGGKVLDICLDEIDGCRPYFLGILGHRYGFIPEGHRHSITAQEIYHGVLHGSVPKQVVDLRKILEEPLEGHTLSIDQKECLVRCYRWDADKRKYLLREDLAPEDADSIRSVFERYSIYQKDRSFFFFRSKALSRQMAGAGISDFVELNREDREKLESLKREIVDAGLPHFEYGDIEVFGQLVLDTLWQRIEAEAAQAPAEERDWLEQEAELHALFMADRTRRFVGRRDLLNRIHEFCNLAEHPSVLVITGTPGCGKSALMARFTEEASRHHPDWLVLGHFVGASPTSTSLRRMLRRLCTHLNRATGATEELQTLLKVHAPHIDSDAEPPKLPDMIWSRLYRSLSAYLFERSGVIDFFHGQLKEAVGKRYLQEESRRDGAHHAIADCLTRRWREPYARALDELPHQHIRARNWQALVAILCDLQFIELKCHAAMTYDLVADYESALAAEGVPVESRSGLDDFARFVQAQSHVLTRNAALTFQRAANEPDSTAPARAAHARLEAGLEARPWFQYVNKPQSRSACLMTLAGHTTGVTACAYSPDGSRIVSVSFDNTLKHWDAMTGAELAFLSGYPMAVSACALSPDGSRVVSASGVRNDLTLRDTTLKLWDAQTGAELATLKGHRDSVTACAFSSDGRRIVSGSGDNTLKIWNAQTGTEVATFEGHKREVNACAFHPDGGRIVSASHDQTLKVWDAQTGAELGTLAGHTEWVQACTFSPDGRRIISASGDRTLKLWDAQTGAERATLKGHTECVKSCAFSPDGGRIVSGSFDQTLKLWDAQTGAELATYKGHRGSVAACAFSPDGRHIVSGSDDSTLKLWDAQTGAELASHKGHLQEVTACAFSPDGRRIVSASNDVTLKLWDAQTGAELATLAGHTREVTACAFSPDGRRIVSASGDRTLRIWGAQTEAELATLRGHRDSVAACAFSPDGRRIVSASRDETLRLWDAKTGAELVSLAGHRGWVWTCAYSPDGSRIVSGSLDSTLKLWDAQTGAELATLAGHTNAATACAFSPDGCFIVSASPGVRFFPSVSRDLTLKLWDAQTGAQIWEYELGCNGETAAWSPRGRDLAVGDSLGQLLILRPQNVSLGPVLVTPWQHNPRRWIPWKRPHLGLHFGCPLCRVWSEVPASALGAAIPCPHCGGSVKLNPFTIHADWRPIATAWTAIANAG